MLFSHLRATHEIHKLESVFGASAEVILEAIHRAPELTRRMLRGVIADAAFAESTIPALLHLGWSDVMPEGNFAFDHKLKDGIGTITIQVKLQRSEKGHSLITNGMRFGLAKDYFMVECQKTRSGTGTGDDGAETKTRPYRFGEFDVLAVSLQPSTGRWDSFRYSVGSWLIPAVLPNQIATYQPVSMLPSEDWTDDFSVVAKWFREGHQKTIAGKQT